MKKGTLLKNITLDKMRLHVWMGRGSETTYLPLKVENLEGTLVLKQLIYI